MTARVAVLTPPGSAAVATIAVVGPAAWDVTRSGFRSAAGRELPTEPDAERHWFGEFGGPPGDTVVIGVRTAQPEPWVEIHCHGGPQVVQWIVEDLIGRGAVTTTWQELVAEFEPSPLRTQALIELSRAVTLRTAAILLDQYHGALDAELARIRAMLPQHVGRTLAALRELLRWSEIGRHLTHPWRIAVAGQPNVGKSSLVNRLVGYPRCVVTPTAGTTRDVVSTAIAIDGWPVELIDTAGQRISDDPLEQAGIALAAEAAKSADLTLWLADASEPAVDVEAPADALRVINKIDLRVPTKNATGLPISALTGQGIDDLLAAIARRLVPAAPPVGAAVPFTPAIADAIESIANLFAAERVTEATAALDGWLGKAKPANPS